VRIPLLLLIPLLLIPLLRRMLKRGAFLSGSSSYLAPLENDDGREPTQEGETKRDANPKTDFGSGAEAR
jgi:hypothetical protein